MGDLIQPYIVAALEKDGWKVDEEVQLRIAGHPLRIDILAERLITLARATERIAIEVKSFRDQDTEEVYHAIGQYSGYQLAFERLSIGRQLYLGITEATAAWLLNDSFFAELLTRHRVRLLVVDIEREEVIQWI